MSIPPICRVLPIFLLSALLHVSFSGIAAARETRIFTNKEGVQIVAELLEIVGKSDVRIRRASDGKEFQFAIATLSLDDQQYIANELKKEAAAHEGDSEGTLIATMPHYRDRLYPITDRAAWEPPEISASATRLAIPAGTWVSYDPSQITGRFLIPYLGETSWKLELDGDRTVWLTRDEGERELVGISLPNTSTGEDTGNRERLAGLDTSLVKNVLNVACANVDDLSLIETLDPDIPLAVAASRKLNAEQLQFLATRKLVALHAEVGFSDLNELEKLDSLTYLCLDIKDAALDAQIELPSLPQLQHLALLSTAGQIKWDPSLQKLPQLRSLTNLRTSREFGKKGTPLTTFANNPYLNFLVLHNRGGNYFSFNALETAPNLRYLKIEKNELKGFDGDYTPIVSLKKLEYLYQITNDLPIGLLDSWSASGALSKLRDYGGRQIPLLENLPKLESITIFKDDSEGSNRDFRRFSTAPESLQKVRIGWLPRTEAMQLEIPHPESVVSLELTSTTIPNTGFLYRFNNLKMLKLAADNGDLDIIDLDSFPSLDHIRLYRIEKLRAVDNFTSHPGIVDASFQNCEFLSGLGQSYTNTTLRALNLDRLPALTSLDALNQVTGCEWLRITDCDALTSCEPFSTNNPLTYFHVHDCEQLPEISISPQVQ